MLSKVNGFPSGRYSSTVTPSWLKSGFITAVTAIAGSKNGKLPRAFRWSSTHIYENEQTIDVTNISGCICVQARPITKAKYARLTKG